MSPTRRTPSMRRARSAAVEQLGDEYSVFKQAVARARLLSRLDRPGVESTILAPTNEAFARCDTTLGLP